MTQTVAPQPRCRFCRTPLELSLVDLGSTPLSNAYVEPDRQDRQDPAYPLHARVCSACFLVQVDDVVPAAEIFSDYAYFSSYSDSWVAHAKTYVEAMIARYSLGEHSRVVEIASNDGYLLQHFLPEGIPVLGIEPAANVAATARAKGVPTEIAFFGRATAMRLRDGFGRADLIVANNVLAHVPDINDMVTGIACLLAPDGVFTAEFPHLLCLIEQTQFDTIYHEHFSYYSLLTIERILAAHGLRAVDVELLPTHGGSLRLFAAHAGSIAHRPKPSLEALRERERAAALDRPEGYRGLEPRVRKIRDELSGFLAQAQAAGKTVAAYGAAAKGNTLLNYCGITAKDVGFVCDRSPAKQGRLMPGSRIPIVAPEEIDRRRPDYVLILPWNLRHEIAVQLRQIRDWGGRLVIPIPELDVFEPPNR
jgi:SAM-dependent methyltransferase